MIQIISSGEYGWQSGRQATGAFAKVEAIDCGPDGLATVEFAGHEFRLGAGVWYLYHTTDAYGHRDPHYFFSKPQAEAKWEEVLKAAEARRLFGNFKNKALARGASKKAAEESARKRLEKLGLNPWGTVHADPTPEEAAAKERDEAAKIFRRDHRLPEYQCWSLQHYAVDGSTADAWFLGEPRQKVDFPVGKHDLAEDPWGNLIDRRTREVVVYIQTVLAPNR